MKSNIILSSYNKQYFILLIVIMFLLNLLSCKNNLANESKAVNLFGNWILNESESIFDPIYHNEMFWLFPVTNDSLKIKIISEQTGKLEKEIFIGIVAQNFLPWKPIVYKNMLFLPYYNNIVVFDLLSKAKLKTIYSECDNIKMQSDATGIYFQCTTNHNINHWKKILEKNLSVMEFFNIKIDKEYNFISWPPLELDDKKIIIPNLFYHRDTKETKNYLLKIESDSKIVDTISYCFRNDKGYGQSEEFIKYGNKLIIRCYKEIMCYDLKMNLIWSVNMERESFGQKIKVHKDVLYYLGEDSYLYGLNIENGSIELKIPSAGTCSNMQISNDNHLYFIGGSNGFLYAINTEKQNLDTIIRPSLERVYSKRFGLGKKIILLYDGSKWIGKPLINTLPKK
jgi:hypothetical protein